MSENATLYQRIRELEKARRGEVEEINARYREMIKALHDTCEHKYGAEYTNQGEIPDTNVFGEPFINRRCSVCGHVLRYLRSKQQPASAQESDDE